MYEELWQILCQQLEFGDKILKITTFTLILSILDLRIMPLGKYDFSNDTFKYFIECVFETLKLIYHNEIQTT